MNDDRPTEPTQDDPRQPDGRPPERIGPYRMLQKVGEGGMGEVYLAEQEQPIRRRVALKIIKRGMDTKQVVARFEAERQALAIMDHPNIAKVFDAGETADGRPYFVMEYVKGEPITEYCDRQRLTIEDRLELFMQACEGVQHAHHKAVIHRDLKPSNILVAVIDGKPVPKIIDFGVAKAIEHRLTERTLFTELGMMVGTPEYMSPEQAEMGATDIDTRTDVYSLGVVLYELLTGALPFDPRELRAAGYDEIRRRIREEDPSKPSTRVTTLGETSTASAGTRRVELRTLIRSLRGDLDWITMKALDKDRTRRYESAQAVADDLQRHLHNQPVSAGPPGIVYRTRKFGLRHRVGIIILALVASLGTSVAGGWIWQASRLDEAQARIVQGERSAQSLISRVQEVDLGLGEPTGVEAFVCSDFAARLDSIAAPGDGSKNAAMWFADFVLDGPRIEEVRLADERSEQPRTAPGAGALWERGRAFLPDEPLLLEAEGWINQRKMSFYGDVWTLESDGLRIPNVLMAVSLARAWVRRGDDNPDLEQAIEDYQRAIRLGRLLRQDDVHEIANSVGLTCIEMGLTAMNRRLATIGDRDRMDRTALALCALRAERLESARVFHLLWVVSDVRRQGLRLVVDIDSRKLDEIVEIVRQYPSRAVRIEALWSLAVVRAVGRGTQQRRASEVLESLVADRDPTVAHFAGWYRDHVDEDDVRASIVSKIG